MPNIPDAAEKAYGLLLENNRVRVLEVRLTPGQKAPMHNHPNDHVVYVVNDAKMKLGFPDGKSSVFELKSGQALWLEAGAHDAENVGKTEVRNIVVEVKK
jgi:beta-alanine degradation protein BauB